VSVLYAALAWFMTIPKNIYLLFSLSSSRICCVRRMRVIKSSSRDADVAIFLLTTHISKGSVMHV